MTWNNMKFWLKSLLISLVVGLIVFIKDTIIEVNATAEYTQLTTNHIYSILFDNLVESFFIFLPLFIVLLLIWWFIEDVKSKENFSKWLTSRTHWKTGAILGGFISSIIPLMGTVISLLFPMKYPFNQIIGDIASFPASIITGIFTGKFFPTQYIGEAGMGFILLIPLSIIMYTLIGALIGFLIQKFKK